MLWVVKLGGSLANSEELPRWLDVIASAGAGKVVLVPGGGPWADEVREAQKREGFDDRTAHRMALRAMEKYGRALIEMQPGLVPAGSRESIFEALKHGRVPVWMPCEMATADHSIPESWDMTSDSLSAWLAHRLNASDLVLVKAFLPDESQKCLDEWARRGWVDPCFIRFARGGCFEVRLLGQGDHALLKEMLTSSIAAGAKSL